MTLSNDPTSVGFFDRIKKMSSRLILTVALILAMLFLGLHFAGIAFYLYWMYWWYDVLMHFLAGIIGGLSAYWVLFCSGRLLSKHDISRKTSVLIVLACMMVVGVGWEVFEYMYDIAGSGEGYVLDTMNDLVLDGCGAALAVIMATRHNARPRVHSL